MSLKITVDTITGRSQRQIISFLGSWIFLNIFMNINYPAPLVSPLQVLLPSLEVWAILLFLSVLTAVSVPFSLYVWFPLIALFALLRLFRFGDVLMPLYFNRPFNLYVDTGYIPDLLLLLYRSFSPMMIAFWLLIILVLLTLSVWLIYGALRNLHTCLGLIRLRRIFWMITIGQAVVVGSYVSGNYPSFAPPPGTSVTQRLIAEAEFIRSLGRLKVDGLSAVELSAVDIPQFAAPLNDLDNVDVHLFLLESYGQTLFVDPQHVHEFVPVISNFSATLQSAGFQVVSHYLRSPAFGGTSWLAFGTFESGVWLENQISYNFLLNSKVQPLASYFNQAGYRSVSVMPGTTMPWPEGKFFSYQKSYYAKDFEYQGPAFGWAPMPDQFVLKTIYRHEIQPRKQPLFVRYVLISSHAPFHLQPRYLNDWNTIGDGRIYHRLDPVSYPINWPDLTNAGQAYVRAMAYEFEVLTEFITNYLPEDSLVVIMGDHQPNGQLTGENPSWLVPVHILTRNHSLLGPFRGLGYNDGMIPADPLAYRRMDNFLSDFLAAYSR